MCRCFQLCDRIGLDPCPLAIDIETISDEINECTNNSNILLEFNQANAAGCSIFAGEWNFSVTVHANSDHVYNPLREMVLQLSTRRMDSNPFWSEYSFPRAQVTH